MEDSSAVIIKNSTLPQNPCTTAYPQR